MKRARTAVVLVLMMILAAGAGVVGSKLSARTAGPPPPAPPDRATLSEELQLTSEQRSTMKGIWEAARDSASQCATDAQKIQHQYDDEVLALLTPEQQVRYKALTDSTKEKVKGLEARREAAFKQAIDRTQQILSESQRYIYQQILRNRIGTSGAGTGVDRVPEDGSTPPATR